MKIQLDRVEDTVVAYGVSGGVVPQVVSFLGDQNEQSSNEYEKAYGPVLPKNEQGRHLGGRTISDSNKLLPTDSFLGDRTMDNHEYEQYVRSFAEVMDTVMGGVKAMEAVDEESMERRRKFREVLDKVIEEERAAEAAKMERWYGSPEGKAELEDVYGRGWSEEDMDEVSNAYDQGYFETPVALERGVV
jgi:hypothetical protein